MSKCAQAGKIAYSAHEYGPYVAHQDWFYAPNFPDNLYGVFSSKWGLVTEKKLGALWVGEFGSFFPPPGTDKDYREREAFTTLIAYIKKVLCSGTMVHICLRVRLQARHVSTHLTSNLCWNSALALDLSWISHYCFVSSPCS